MMMLAYSAALTLALALSAPWWLVRMATTHRYREGLRERLGRVPAHLRSTGVDAGAPHLDSEMWAATNSTASRPRTLWLHAVSVGEVLAATRLVADLEAALPNHRLVISTTTRTGQALARVRFGPDASGNSRVFYFPLDFAFAVRAWLDALQPAALLLMESELWPRMLDECARRNIPVAVVNARVSDRSFRRTLRFRKLWQRMAAHVTLWLAQSEQDAQRLTTLLASTNAVILSETTPTHPVGASETTSTDPVILSEGIRHNSVILSEGARGTSRAPQSKDPDAARTPTTAHAFLPAKLAPQIRVTGNLKYDIRAPQQSRIAQLIREAAAGRPIVVAGSTVGENPPEDSPLIRVQQSFPKERRPLLVLAPRHPENFSLIYSMAIEFPTLLASELLAGKDGSQGYSVRQREKEREPAEIIVLDTIGDLAAVYGIATIAFIGGSLVARGGHNPLEPAQFGVPVIMGPSFENFRDIVAKMQQADAIRILGSNGKGIALNSDSVKNPVLYDQLEAALHDLLSDPDAARALGERGRRVFESQQGATARAVAAILSLLSTTTTLSSRPESALFADGVERSASGTATNPGAPFVTTAPSSSRVGPRNDGDSQ